jgi:3-methyladenine DNA glycosylase AlkD
MPNIETFKKDFKSQHDPARVPALQRFFKTGPGEYAEGDVFYGLSVPAIRKLAKKYGGLSLREIREIIQSPVHEERLASVIILVEQFSKADASGKKKICDFYLRHTRWINNWDLVDASAEHVIGPFLEKDKSLLKRLAKSPNLWQRRIAVISTFHHIKKGRPDFTLEAAEILLKDEHDLIHKAVGWMLREVGKRCSQEVEESFLKKYYLSMPRTMLRYAIERFSPGKRKFYLAKN